MIKWFFVIVMFIHGIIHLMGGVNELGLAKIKELTGKTVFPVSGPLQTVLGICWFLVVAMFLAATIGLLANQPWWKSIAITAVIVSQALILIWWPAAKWGTIANVLVILAAWRFLV